MPSVKNYLEGYKEKLQEPKSSSRKSYFIDGNDDKSNDIKAKASKNNYEMWLRTQDDLDARLFQFILDRAKDSDPLKLNEIYSHTKKYRQKESTNEEKAKAKEYIEKYIKESELPSPLKTDRDYQDNAVFKEGTFLHFVNNYYKLRQRARDGRLYIHPQYSDIEGRGYENAGRYDDAECLLTYCNHKPRQKRYQMLEDVAALFRISTQDLSNLIGIQKTDEADEKCDKLSNWLSSIQHLKTNCERAAKEQKERGGYLKLDVQRVYGLIHHRKQNSDPTGKEIKIKEILKESKVKDANKFYTFCERIKELIKTQIFESFKNIWGDKQWQQNINDLERKPASAIYLLAQINNIVFQDRSGNASTCAVCSADNAQRMQTASESEDHAKASRLPAIATRVIDGAVMRMARIVGGAIAKDKWEKIEGELKQGRSVRVPIITEANRFEFELNLKKLKNKVKKEDSEKPGEANKRVVTMVDEKEDRIKKASKRINPYPPGNSIGDDGEIDHIIPRSSKWGTLNDEANLIHTSKEANKEKDENEYNLANLSTNYKQTIFNSCSNDEEIRRWIEDKIGDGSDEYFKFGRYYSFSVLGEDEQKAFRHALFLEKNHPLRKKVINAISNRNRAFVNGTQRYFSEVLANSLYKEAKKIGKAHLLSFDYFGVEAWSDSRGDNIKELREAHELIDSSLEEYKKSGGQSQKAYSHLIDAQMAFAIAANQHKNDGSLKLKISNNIKLWPFDKDTGEWHGSDIFNVIRINPEEMQEEKEELKRRKPYEVETHHRMLLNNNKKHQVHISYQIHRDSIIAEKFFPLIKHQGEIKMGFHLKNTKPYKEKDFETLKLFLQKCNNTTRDYEVWVIKKREAQDFLMKVGFRGANADEKKICRLLDNLSYQTRKKSIQSVLELDKTSTVDDALDVWDSHINEEKFKKEDITLPIYSEWLKLKDLLDKADRNKPLQKFLETCPMFSTKHGHAHKKVRKVYSLPVIETIGNIRLRRTAWDGRKIYQTVPEESHARYDAGRPHTILSKNSVPKKHYEGHPKKYEIGQEVGWSKITDKIGSDETVSKAEIKYQDSSRYRIKIKMAIAEFEKLSCFENEIEIEDKWNKKSKQTILQYIQSECGWFQDKQLPVDINKSIEIGEEINGARDIEFSVRGTQNIKRFLSEDN